MSAQSEFKKLIEIMKQLRKACPWDRKQTPKTLRQYILEEAYETIESIDNEDWEELQKELGDLLLQIIFQAEIAEEDGRFTLEDVIRILRIKLVRRHPHVFGDITVKNEDEVKENWEQIKIKEENRKSLLEGVPRNLSALLKAQRIQDKASQVGFDWDTVTGIFEKIREETTELEKAIENGIEEDIENEIGDILFSVVNLARFCNINAENASRRTTNKFISRFQYIEQKLLERGKSIYNSSLEEMDKLWEEAKSKV